MKKILVALRNNFIKILLKVPSHSVRIFIYRCIFKQFGNNTFIFLGLDYKEPSKISIGNNCVVNKNCLLDGRGGNLKIGNNVDIAQNVQIWTLDHDPHDDYHRTRKRSVVIEDNVWICTRSIILPGVKIGNGAVISANSLVTKDVEPRAIVGGIPAKFISTRKSEIKYKLNHFEYFE